MANPLDDLIRGFNVLRAQVAQRVGGDADWLERIDPRQAEAEPRSLEELQAELDSLVGLESIKGQVRALVAFLQVQAQRLEHGLPEVATSQHLVFLGNPGTGKSGVWKRGLRRSRDRGGRSAPNSPARPVSASICRVMQTPTSR